VPIENAQATVAAVKRLFDDRELARQLGMAGRETILHNLQWKDTLSSLNVLYGNTATRRPLSRNKLKYPDLAALNAEVIRKDKLRWQNKHHLRVK
jgi:hypothetical protein